MTAFLDSCKDFLQIYFADLIKSTFILPISAIGFPKDTQDFR